MAIWFPRVDFSLLLPGNFIVAWIHPNWSPRGHACAGPLAGGGLVAGTAKPPSPSQPAKASAERAVKK